MAQAQVAAKQNQERARMARVLSILKREYPEARCSLNYATPFQLLVATILSAQCTDERVNRVTPALFARFPDARAMAEATPTELEALIKSAGFYRAKAKSLLRTSQLLVKNHDGEVPKNLEALVEFPGVGRKTANVLLGNAFGIPGLVVDTHVGRLCRRLGFTRHTDPVKVEHAMMEIVPREDWTLFSHLLIAHGRAVCSARTLPHCERCAVASYCPKVGVPRARSA